MKKKIKRERENSFYIVKKGEKIGEHGYEMEDIQQRQIRTGKTSLESKNSSIFLEKYKLSKSFLLHSFPSMTLLYSCCPRAVKNFFLFSLAEWLYKYCHHDITYSFRIIPHLEAACLPFIFVFLLQHGSPPFK